MVKMKMGKWEVDEEELDRQHAEAVKRGKERMKKEPRWSDGRTIRQQEVDG